MLMDGIDSIEYVHRSATIPGAFCSMRYSIKALTYQLATHHEEWQGDESRLLKAAAGQLEMNIQHFASIDNDSLGELSEPVTWILVKANSTIRARGAQLTATVITYDNDNYSVPVINY